jgi:SAM-dependent MidA family methyltransferase
VTPLEDKIRKLIRHNGPISIADYFALCIGDPQHGYYSKRDPLGTAGDFTTAPEISQLFGEMVGLCLVLAWQARKKPGNVHLIELGPGRGTLMADVQRVIHTLAPDLAAAATAHLVETSAYLQTIQGETLKNAPIPTLWHTDFDQVDSGFTLLFSNELFDALPVRQFVKTDRGWRERTVALDTDGALEFQAGPATIDAPGWAGDAANGEIIEMAPAREALMSRLAERLVRQGGLALTIDYGHGHSAPGDTLQAVRNHLYADVLSNPGDCDLTSHVDFEALAAAARAEGAHVWPLLDQGRFLLSLGLVERAGALGSAKSAATQEAIRQAVERLAATGDGQMGSLFKVLCISGDDLPCPPFFAESG